MSFRARLFLAFAAAVLIPLGLFAVGVRREMERRLATENEARAQAAVEAIRGELQREGDGVATRLAALGAGLAADNRFRLATSQGDAAARRYLLDLAGGAMRLSGLSSLQLHDSAGRILSSGHFRNEYDRLDPELPRLLAGAGPALLRVRTPEAPLLVVARVDSFGVGGRRFTLIGGAGLAAVVERLSHGSGLMVSVVLPGEAAPSTAGEVVGDLALPYVDAVGGASPRRDTARLLVTQSSGTLMALRRSIARWSLVALAVTAGLAMAAAAWLSARVSRPLRELADKTAAIDLDRLDQDFASDRRDEIGALSRLLGAMTERLRRGAARIREVERHAATGDLARQVNHDIKNGLVPIRNVVRHLGQVARDEPASLARVYAEREGTLETSLAYLDTLARNYARLSPALQREPCDLNAVVEEVLHAAAPGSATLGAALDGALPPVAADRLVLRRILENLVGNAIESLAGRDGGTVTVSTEQARPAGQAARVRVTVSDTGPGMSRAELDRAFDDFHTTKEGGTGLGLSIVRRLVLDLDGALRIETAPGEGTRAIVELPADGAPR